MRNHETNILILSLCISLLSINAIGQNKSSQNELAVSAPLIWNKTEIYNSYSGVRAKNISGTAVSHGINLTYSRTVYKGLFAAIGMGYYQQTFGIKRPFDYDDPSTNLLYWTDKYYYQCVQYIGGLGYRHELNKFYKIKGLITYNQFNTFRQKFDPQYISAEAGGRSQVENKKYTFGKSVIIAGNISRNLSKKFSIGIDLLLPVYNRWRKKQIFRENTNEFYGSKITIGTGITASYKF